MNEFVAEWQYRPWMLQKFVTELRRSMENLIKYH